MAACAPGGFVGGAPCEEELPAAGGIGGMSAATHPRERQEAQQHEVVQGDDEFLDQSARLLKRNAAGKVRLGLLQKSRHPRQAVGGQPHVGIEEHQQRMASRLCQERAGELLATPASGRGCPRKRRTRESRSAMAETTSAVASSE